MYKNINRVRKPLSTAVQKIYRTEKFQVPDYIPLENLYWEENTYK